LDVFIHPKVMILIENQSKSVKTIDFDEVR
jgi:hypothetical protein